MPPVSSPASSRGALVTWAVVFAALWAVASVAAIYFYANASKVQDQYDLLRKQYIPDIIAESELNSDAVRHMKELRTQEGTGLNPSMSAFSVALALKDQMATLVAGAGGKETADAVAKQALQTAGNAAKAVGLSVPATDNLALALTTVANGLSAEKRQSLDLQDKLKAATDQNAAQQAQFDQQRTEMNKTLEAVRAEQQKMQQDVSAYQQSKDASVGEIQKGVELERKQSADAVNAAQVQIAQLNHDLQAANQKIETLQAKFADKRVNTQDPIVRHPDGRIIRIPAKDVVYIDLGTAESVTPGLTFEVYDKVEGIPPAGDPSSEDNLPKGKASIEVVRPGQGSSECRILRQTPGTQIVEGDLIANLVFDRNVKYNFVVYGDFDMDRNGVATPADADIIKRLITQWGGKIVDQVNVDTDFVVLGKEPVLPVFTKEELQDPFNAKKLADAQAALEAYQQVRTNAQNLHIPILNQNRFLYLIGYYDQAKR
jgi:hypothetical protein